MAQYQAEVRISTDFTVYFEADSDDDAEGIASRAADLIQYESTFATGVTTEGVNVEVVYDGPYDTEVVQEPWTEDDDEA